MSKKKHLGTNLDAFLEEEGILGETEALAIKRVLAHQIEIEMRKRHLSKKSLAELMGTSRSSLDRLLDPDNTSVTLSTLAKAAAVIDKRINISFL